MKRKLLKGVLTFSLAVSMIAGSLYIPTGSQNVQAAQLEESAARAEKKIWDLTAASTSQRPTLEDETGEYDGILIDSTQGKFSPRESDTQINAGTILMIPVQANADGATLTFKLSGGSATVTVGEKSYGSADSVVTIPLETSEEDSECAVTFISQAYLASIELTYNESEEEYPGVPEGGRQQMYHILLRVRKIFLTIVVLLRQTVLWKAGKVLSKI